MNRFFVPKEQICGDVATITGNDAKHISKVLRMIIGDEIELCDGKSNEYVAQIISVTPAKIKLKLMRERVCASESAYRITLFQCMPKTGKMELIIQKCVELGVFEIAPVISERCVVRVDEKSAENKCMRYNRIAYEAAKQCGRGVIPEVLQIEPLSDIDFSHFDLTLIPYECETEVTLKQVLSCSRDVTSIAIVIGPEGGFTHEEVACVKKHGGRSVSLGKRILRTETAGLATIAMINYEMEG